MMGTIIRTVFILALIFLSTYSYSQSNLVPDSDELTALRALWESTGGASWTTKTNWPTAGSWPSTATATQMDAWYGITVTNGDITQIILNNNALNGHLPDELGLLTKLDRITVNDNNLSGQIPSSIGQCTGMLNLFLQNNQFSGSIPPELGNLTLLQTLYLNNNHLSGTIPSSLSGLTSIVYFDIHYNQLTGTVPDIFSGLTHLYNLTISYNRLTGTLPPLRGSVIDVRDNQFSGAFPAVSGTVTVIFGMDNLFTSINSSIASQTSMFTFNLANNELTSLPSGLLTRSNRSSLALTLNSNRLDFSVLEPFAAAGFNSGSSYGTQKTINDVTLKAITYGSPLVLTARPLGTNTSISWQKQNGASWTTLSNTQTYTQTSSASSDEGVYKWVMTSTSFSFSISSDPITVKSNAALTLDNWCFQYKYDSRKRMTQKKVAGADWVYMVYDDRDRLVLTQDGNQRASNLWTFTKYDLLNRPILTGIKDTTVALTQSAMQAVVDQFYTRANSKWGESRGTTVHGYSNKSFPYLPDPQKYLTVTYYDDYAWKNTMADSARLSFRKHDLTGQTNNYFRRLTGMQTGTKVKVLDGGTWGATTWLTSSVYYDDRQRVIQTVTDNYKGGTDRITNKYDFTGKVLETKTTQENYDVTWTDRVGVSQIGNRIVSIQSSNGWGYSGTASIEKLAASTKGWIEATVNENTGSTNVWYLGLSSSNPNAQLSSIQYGIGVNAGNVATVESGAIANRGSVAKGDVLRVQRDSTTAIKFYKNGSVIGTAGTTSSTALMADAALYWNSNSFVNVRASFAKRVDSVHRWFDYDDAGRLTKTWHKYKDGTKVLLADNEYNELGQLADKKLHSTDNGATNEQSIDYRYNIRGWLTSINGSDLDADEDINPEDDGQKRDLFGMNLLYNNVESGLSNTALYNGNISAMKWSNNLGIGDKKHNAYKYSYDPMNRLLSAGFAQKQSTWQNATDAFKESIGGYDLNGNILSLTRKDKSGAVMDDLSYSYGTDAAQSNKLLNVTDAGSKTDGFIEGINTDNDYGYDANGNMLFDQNKGIVTAGGNIVYNYLNLPETVTRGGPKIYYVYDATGKKLAQSSGYGVGVRRVDYAGEFQYEENVLTQLNTEEGRVVTSAREQVYTNSCDDATTAVAVNTSMGVTKINGESYLQVVSKGTTNSGLFPIGDVIRVHQGERYLVRAKGYQSASGYLAYLQVKINGTAVDYPNGAFAFREGTESWIEQVVTIRNATDSIMQIGMLWQQTSPSLTFYLNEIEVVKVTSSTPEYQYHLKDHLGNVRMTFTTKDEVDSATATVDNANATAENSEFLNYDKVRRVNHPVYDHTYDHSTSPDGTTYAMRLNGSSNERIGLAKSISVMPGDTLKIEVFAKYYEPPVTPNSGLFTLLMAAITGGTAPGGVVVDGSGYLTNYSTTVPGVALDGKSNEDSGPPKAYLNWLVFDRDYNLIASKSGYKRITTAAKEDSTNVPHERIAPDDDLVIDQAGYVYIYLSNENEVPVEVYFDDFKVEHIKSPVISSQDYYPFGYTFNTNVRENSLVQRSLYQEKDWLDELNLNLYDFDWRQYDPLIARTTSMDPHAESYLLLSPYSWAANNPIIVTDPDGQDISLTGAAAQAYVGELQKQIASSGAKDEPRKVLSYNSQTRARREQMAAAQRENQPGFFTGVKDGVVAGGMSTIDFVKSLGTLGGWINLAKGTLATAEMANPSSPALMELAVSTSASAANIGDLSAYQWGYGVGYGAEKFGEFWLTRRLMMPTATGGRAFFSGAGTEAQALSRGFTTLGQTRAGRNLAKLTAGMPYYPGSHAYKMWGRLSAQWAKGASGEVHVFQNAAKGVELQSIWRVYEYPALRANPNVTNIIYHY
ncbi:MAG: RHS repeat-associated core domain-containing protein [Bacteroidota bacterium]